MTGRRRSSAMTRRSVLLLALSATTVTPSLMAEQTKPVISARRLNNVRLVVSDLDRSTAFYQRLFGPPVREGDAVVFRIGEGSSLLCFDGGRERREARFPLLRRDS
jgi:hypothetical protein